MSILVGGDRNDAGVVQGSEVSSMSETRRELIDSAEAALEASARLPRNIAEHRPAALSGTLADAFPWVEFLPGPEREMFADELTRARLAESSVDSCAPFAQLVREWRATAEICADPELARRLAAPIDDPTGGPVLVPPG